MQQFPEKENKERESSRFRDMEDVSIASHSLSNSKSTADESNSLTSPVLRNSSVKRAHSEMGLVFLRIWY